MKVYRNHFAVSRCTTWCIKLQIYHIFLHFAKTFYFPVMEISSTMGGFRGKNYDLQKV